MSGNVLRTVPNQESISNHSEKKAFSISYPLNHHHYYLLLLSLTGIVSVLSANVSGCPDKYLGPP